MEVGGGSGAHWLRVCLAEDRGMSGGREDRMKGGGMEKVEKSCQSERQRINACRLNTL